MIIELEKENELFALVEVLANYHISVRQVKSIFNLFLDSNIHFKSYYWQNIFPLLERLWNTRRDRPDNYFQFDGSSGGIILPPWKLPSKGYTFIALLNVSDFKPPDNKGNYLPYFFTFYSDNQVGFEAFWDTNRELTIRINYSRRNQNVQQSAILEYTFSSNKWYLIAISHRYNLFKSDSLVVYINGEKIQEFQLKYLRLDCPLNFSLIGMPHLDANPQYCFNGKIAGFLMFNYAIGDKDALALHKCGPNIFSSLHFLDEILAHNPSRSVAQSSIVFIYVPCLIGEKHCFSPLSSDPENLATKLSGVRECITTGFSVSLFNVGGIQLLLPLFSSRYRPRIGTKVDVNSKVIRLITVLINLNEFYQMEMYRTRFFEIMGYLLATDFDDLRAMDASCSTFSATKKTLPTANVCLKRGEESSGSGDIDPTRDVQGGIEKNNKIDKSLPLDYIAATHSVMMDQNVTDSTHSLHHCHTTKISNKWSPESIRLLDQLSQTIMNYGSTKPNAKVSNLLFKQFFRYIYLNFRIWHKADYDVQLQLLKSIYRQVSANPKYVHTFFSVTELITILHEYYSKSSDTNCNKRTIITPINHNEEDKTAIPLTLEKQVDAQLPAHHSLHVAFSQDNLPSIAVENFSMVNLLEIRQVLLRIAHSLTNSYVEMTFKEIKSIICYLVDQFDQQPINTSLIMDVLQFTISGIDSTNLQLIQSLHQLDVFTISLTFLRSNNQTLRVYVLKMIGRLIQALSIDNQYREFMISNIFLLKQILQPYMITSEIYYVLLEIMLDSVHPSLFVSPIDLAQDPKSKHTQHSLIIKNVAILPIIFSLINGNCTISLKSQVVKDLLFLSIQREENLLQLMREQEFPEWIFSLIQTNNNDQRKGKTITNEDEKVSRVEAEEVLEGDDDEEERDLLEKSSSLHLDSFVKMENINDIGGEKVLLSSNTKENLDISTGPNSIMDNLADLHLDSSDHLKMESSFIITNSNFSHNTRTEDILKVSKLEGNMNEDSSYVPLVPPMPESHRPSTFKSIQSSQNSSILAKNRSKNRIEPYYQDPPQHPISTFNSRESLLFSKSQSSTYLDLFGNIIELFVLVLETAISKEECIPLFERILITVNQLAQNGQFNVFSLINSINIQVIHILNNKITDNSQLSEYSHQIYINYLIFIQDTMLIIPNQALSAKTISNQCCQPVDDDDDILFDVRQFRFLDIPLLSMNLIHDQNEAWISYSLSQQILELIDKLSTTDKGYFLFVARKISIRASLKHLKLGVGEFYLRLVLYSLIQSISLKALKEFSNRRNALHDIHLIVFQLFGQKSILANDDNATLELKDDHHAHHHQLGKDGTQLNRQVDYKIQKTLYQYLQSKGHQWATDMSNPTFMLIKNMSRLLMLTETISCHDYTMYLMAFCHMLMMRICLHANSGDLTPPALSSTMTMMPSSFLVSSSKGEQTSSLLKESEEHSDLVQEKSYFHSLHSGQKASISDSSIDMEQVVVLVYNFWYKAMLNIKSRLGPDETITFSHFLDKLPNQDNQIVSFFQTTFNVPKSSLYFPLSNRFRSCIQLTTGRERYILKVRNQHFKKLSKLHHASLQILRKRESNACLALDKISHHLIDVILLETKKMMNLYHIRYSQYFSVIASDWRNLLRILIDARGPWAFRDHQQDPNNSNEVTTYWKLDPVETSQRMRIKLKRHYGDLSQLKYANDLNTRKWKCRHSATLERREAVTTTIPSTTSKSLSNMLQLDCDILKHFLQLTRSKTNSNIKDNDQYSDSNVEEIFSSTLEMDNIHLTTTLNPINQVDQPEGDNLECPISSPSPQLAIAASRVILKIQEDTTLLTTKCEYVKGIQTIVGDFELTTSNIYFRSLSAGFFKTVSLEKVEMIYTRRYMLRLTALEIFTTFRTSYFFNFLHEHPSRILESIANQKLPNLREYFSGQPINLAKKKKRITDAWCRRKISNFEYLMQLNTIAGRTYNDLTQYPVFPWILSNYTSDNIDLEDPKNYRDLSKPIGALSSKRLEKLHERWQVMISPDADGTPPFLYGSHYSTHAIVLYYLIRMEPFTTYALHLQGGYFDAPARIFSSIPETWLNCLENASDVKELIPEFFFQPEMLSNTNSLDLGERNQQTSTILEKNQQDGGDRRNTMNTLPLSTQGQVKLPPWAQTAHDFIQINRMALESEYVSAHLHEWIDLIFGYKQNGQEAINADNVFYYSSYENNIDLDSISDPILKKSLQMQIREFGQTPSQLFQSPHPSRYTLPQLNRGKRNMVMELVSNALGASSPEAEIWQPTRSHLAQVKRFDLRPAHESNCSIITFKIDSKLERIVVIYEDGLVQLASYKAPMVKKDRFLFSLSVKWTEADLITNPKRRNEFTLHKMPISSSWSATHDNHHSTINQIPMHCCFAFNKCKTLIHCGNWDRSTIVTHLDASLSAYNTINEHKDVVTCVAISQDGSTLVTGSRDCNVQVWDFGMISAASSNKKVDHVQLKPCHTLFGHDDVINWIAINHDLDLIVTASKDHTCILYSINKGRYYRTIYHEEEVTMVSISLYGDIVTYCPQGEILSLYTVNGLLLKRLNHVGQLRCIKFSNDAEFLIVSFHHCIVVRSMYMYRLKIIQTWKISSQVTYLELFNQDEYLLMGCVDGTLQCTTFNPNKILRRYVQTSDP